MVLVPLSDNIYRAMKSALPASRKKPQPCWVLTALSQQGISSSSSIKLCEGGVDVSTGPLPTRTSGIGFAILKAGVVKCSGSPLEQKMLEIIVMISTVCMPSADISAAALDYQHPRGLLSFPLEVLLLSPFAPFTVVGPERCPRSLNNFIMNLDVMSDVFGSGFLSLYNLL